MSDRERWIVYPLLFLSLGSSLRPKLTGEFEVAHIRCEAIEADFVGNEKQPVHTMYVRDLNGGAPVVIRLPIASPAHKPGAEKESGVKEQGKAGAEKPTPEAK